MRACALEISVHSAKFEIYREKLHWMTSAEPDRRSAYSRDIALRVVWMRLGMSLSFKSIADRLQIGLGSAYRLYHRYVRTGNLTARKRSDRPQYKKLDEYHELLIL